MDDEQHEDRPTLKILTTVSSSTEATILVGDLESSGIPATQRPDARVGGLWGGLPGSRAVYVAERDLERAQAVLNAPPISEGELVEAEEDAAAHGTEPAKD